MRHRIYVLNINREPCGKIIQEYEIYTYFSYCDIECTSKELDFVVKNYDLNRRQPMTGYTALHCYLHNNYFTNDVLKILLEHGADVTMKTNSGYTPVHILLTRCCNVSHDIVMDIIGKNKTNSNYCLSHRDYSNLLLEYIKSRYVLLKDEDIDEKIVSTLLDNGIDPNFKHEGYTALHYYYLCLAYVYKPGECRKPISIKKAKRIISLFIKHGANIDELDNSGNTPFHLYLNVETCDNIHMTKMLLTFNHNLEIRNNNGLTPILCYITSDYIHHDIIVMLISHYETNFGEISIDDRRVLVFEFIKTYSTRPLDSITYLMNRFKNIDIHTRYEGKTLLHVACEYNNPQVIDYLVRINGDINALTDDNKHATQLIIDNKESSPYTINCLLYILGYIIDKNVIRSLVDQLPSLPIFDIKSFEKFISYCILFDDTFYDRHVHNRDSKTYRCMFSKYMSFLKYDETITRCHNEIILLKLSAVLDSTLYSVLRCHNSRKLKRYLNVLKKYNNDKSFKIYNNIINQRYTNVFRKDIYVTRALNKLFPIFTDTCCMLSRLPSEIMYEILYMLTVYDLHMIVHERAIV
ncbi:ankyrin [Raccoonpox virus]|uniref:Ankyrin n=1 Tax=Raccoon poxvirus TaxID=10256 RepID=A0A0G3FXZ3_RACVI|nr:Ankyrin [Raccoonpox virus]AKJ93823.1 Ankyrin [Raccoonpox virus]AOP31457.1 ankyrin [Raccoonpox virus]